MSWHNVEFIIGTISLVFAYLFSVTIVGIAETAVAEWAGDDTAKETGLLSGNPLTYLDLIGFICTMVIGFGWGRISPFNPYNATEPHRLRKVFLVYMSQPFFSLVVALCALTLNVFLVGPGSLRFALWNSSLSKSMNVPLQQLAEMCPHSSSTILVFAVILLSIISINTFIATWSLINNFFYYILFVGAERGHDYMKHAEALSFFGPFIILVLFTGPLRIIFLTLLAQIAYWIASLCGACL